ncbi:MAG: hypothetical protein DWH70_10530 [Planctomycetota bacterium]|nr:MAG: hypothetical protein DWH70_10530 [Planctomycetota bacterium]
MEKHGIKSVGVEVGMQAKRKGPFPGGKRVGSWAKVKESKKENKREKVNKRPSKSKTELHLMRGDYLACMNEHKTPL